MTFLHLAVAFLKLAGEENNLEKKSSILPVPAQKKGSLVVKFQGYSP